MKKVINGKMYNTETAQFLGEKSFGYRGDLDYCCEEIYRKKTGEFFLYGEGGAATQYAERIDNNSWGGGNTITPLTEAEAKEMLERWLTADEYIEIFGDVEE